METEYNNCVVICIIVLSGVLGGITNYLMMFDSKLDSRENCIKFFASLFLSLCASFSVPLFLQILSNNLLDELKFKNLLIFGGFCVVASFFSKRFLEDVYSKLNKLERDVNKTKKDIKAAEETTSKVKIQVEELEESTEEVEIDEIPNEIKSVISKLTNLNLSGNELEDIVKALFSTKYSYRTIEGIKKETKLGIDRIKEILNHLVEQGFARKKVGFDGKDLYKILKHPVVIYKAVYVWPGDFRDVTEKLKEMTAKGIYFSKVDPIILGLSNDPAYGKLKILKVHFRAHGVEKELSWADGETFILN